MQDQPRYELLYLYEKDDDFFAVFLSGGLVPGHGVGVHLEVPGEALPGPEDVQHLVVLLGLRVARHHLHRFHDEHLAVREDRRGPELVPPPAEGRRARFERHRITGLPRVKASQILDHFYVHSLSRIDFQFQLNFVADRVQNICFSTEEKGERLPICTYLPKLKTLQQYLICPLPGPTR